MTAAHSETVRTNTELKATLDPEKHCICSQLRSWKKDVRLSGDALLVLSID